MREKFVQKVKQTSLSIVKNQIQAVRRKSIKKTGCRILSEGKIGVSGGLGDINEDVLFSRAEQMLRYAVEYGVEPTKNVTDERDYSSLNFSDNELCNRINSVLGACAARHPDFYISNKVNFSQIEIALTNDLGMTLGHKDSYLSLSFLIKSKDSTGILDTFFGLVDRNLEEERVIAAVDEIISAFKTPVDLSLNELPVVISQDLLTRLFQRDLNGKMVGNGASLFQQQIGQKIFADSFSLKINNDPTETFGPVFDLEGTIAPDSLSWLIKDGMIIRPYTDKKTSKQFGFDNTGCAGGAYDSVPSLGTCNMEIMHCGKTLKELLNGGKAILVSMASGGDFTPDGQFASPVQLAYLTDGEKLLGRLPELTIKGSVFDFCGKDFSGVSSDKIFFCGNERLAVVNLKTEKL